MPNPPGTDHSVHFPTGEHPSQLEGAVIAAIGLDRGSRAVNLQRASAGTILPCLRRDTAFAL
jgi:hypothetical protein